MADPNDAQTDVLDEVSDVPADEKSDLSGADQAFLDAMGQGKGLRSEASESLVNQAFKLKSIRRRFLTNVLPILLIPLLLLGLLAIAGLNLLGSRTTGAVDSTDDILIEHNEAIEAELTPIAIEGANVVNDFLAEWFAGVQSIEGSQASAEATIQSFPEDLSAADVQVLFVRSNGSVIDSSHDTTLDNYSGAAWLTRAQESDQFRSFVDDGEHTPSIEFALALEDGTFARVRVPFTNLQQELDQASEGEGYDFNLVDLPANVLVADTASNHDASIVFNSSAVDAAGFDLGTTGDSSDVNATADDERVNVPAAVLEGVSPQDFPFVDLEWVVQVNQPIDSISRSLLGFRGVAEDVNVQQRSLSLGIGLILSLIHI